MTGSFRIPLAAPGEVPYHGVGCPAIEPAVVQWSNRWCVDLGVAPARGVQARPGRDA